MASGKVRHRHLLSIFYFTTVPPKTFNVGTGLSDKLRRKPPKIGAIIVYRFQELTNDGVPRFPSFIGEAADKDEPKDAEVPEHKKVSVKADGDA